MSTEEPTPPPPPPPKVRLLRLRGAARAPSLARLAPSAITAIAIALGFVGVIRAIHGDFLTAIYLMMAAGLLDIVDGGVARVLRASSDFGAELDSLADFFNFGFVPALILYLLLRGDNPSLMAAMPPMLYCVCCALRLARFNVEKSAARAQPDVPEWTRIYFFRGLPAPAAAAFMGWPFYLYLAGVDVTVPALAWTFHGLALVLGLLMISPVPFLAARAALRLRVHREIAPFALAAFIASLISAAARPAETMMAITGLYALGWPVAFWIRRRALDRFAQTRAAEAEKAG